MTEQQFEIEKGKNRRLRIALLRAYTKRLQEAMQRLRPKDATWAEVTGGLRMVMNELRIEYRSSVMPEEGGAQPAEEPRPQPSPLKGIQLFRPTGS